MRAVANSPELAVVWGIPADRVLLSATALGAALAAVAGIFVAADAGMSPEMGMRPFMASMVAAIIGGTGSIWGIACASLLISVLQNTITWSLGGKWEDAIAFVALLGFLWLRPQGLAAFGHEVQASSTHGLRYSHPDPGLHLRHLAASLDLVMGQAGLVSLCHAAFFGLGAYTSALMALKLGTPFALNAVAGIILAGGLGALVGTPGARVRDDYFVLSTLCFQVVVVTAMANWDSLTRGPIGLVGIPRPSFLGHQISSLGAFTRR